jgi:hypothetical protein
MYFDLGRVIVRRDYAKYVRLCMTTLPERQNTRLLKLSVYGRACYLRWPCVHLTQVGT